MSRKSLIALAALCFVIAAGGFLRLAFAQAPLPEAQALSSDKTGRAFTLTSAAFKPGQPIPRIYTADGQDVSPPLTWQGIPRNTKQLALIVDDPDAPHPQPWVHWVIYNLAPTVTSLPAHMPHGKTLNHPHANQGINSFARNNQGYRGPSPPPGKVHHYHFTLYALDKSLNLPPGKTRNQLLAAIKYHVIAKTQLIGTYRR